MLPLSQAGGRTEDSEARLWRERKKKKKVSVRLSLVCQPSEQLAHFALFLSSSCIVFIRTLSLAGSTLLPSFPSLSPSFPLTFSVIRVPSPLLRSLILGNAFFTALFFIFLCAKFVPQLGGQAST